MPEAPLFEFFVRTKIKPGVHLVVGAFFIYGLD